MYPQSEVTYGQSGTAVTQLQNFLISQGMSIPAGATGYFGNETKAALAQWQNGQGITGAGIGTNWGPQSIATASKVNSGKAPVQDFPGLEGGTPMNSNGVPTNTSTPYNANIVPPTNTSTPYNANSTTTSATIPSNTSGSSDSYTVGQRIKGGNANTAGTIQYVYTYQGNGNWSKTDTLNRPYGQVTTAQIQSTDPQSGIGSTSGTGNTGSTSGTSGTSGTGSTSGTSTDTSGQGIPYDPSWAARGVSVTDWNNATAMERAIISAAMLSGQTTNSTGNKYTVEQGFTAALNDPSFLAQFSDQFKVDQATLASTIQQIQSAATVDSQNNAIQFQTDRLNLANTSAAAGQAYSGFRNLAQQNLATTESGIVESSKSAIQKQLDAANAAFASKYGTAAAAANNPASTQFVNPYTAANVNVAGLSQSPNLTATTMNGAMPQGVQGTTELPSGTNTLGGTDYQTALDTYAQNFVATGGAPTITSLKA